MENLWNRLARVSRSPRIGIYGFALAAVITTVSLLPGGGEAVGASSATGATFGASPLTSANLSATLSQTKFVQGGDGRVYITVDLSAPAITTTGSRKPVDMVVVLDRSGSMASDNKLSLAKSAITDLARRLNAEDRMALVTFDNAGTVNLPLAPVSDAQREIINQTVNGLQPGGSTNISDGVERAYEQLHAANSAGRARKILLLSDGQANLGITDNQGLNSIASRAKTEEAMLSTIGMGLGFNEMLMSSMADFGMGSYGYLEHLGKLNEILVANLEETRNVYARASELEVALSEGVTIVDASGYPINRSATGVSIPLGQLQSGAAKHVMLTATVPTGSVQQLNVGSLRVVLTRETGDERLEVSGKAFDVAVLAPEHREEAIASVNTEVWQKAWTQNNLGMMRRDVADAVRKGDRAAAAKTANEYRQKIEQEGKEKGIALNSPTLSAELDAIDSKVSEAFSGSAAQQQERQNSVGKAFHQEALSEQRK